LRFRQVVAVGDFFPMRFEIRAREAEGNRTEWKHLFLDNLDDALGIIPGTKTEESLEILPIPRRHAENLLRWRKLCPSRVWVFPSCAPHSKNYGGKMYGRQRMFRRTEKQTGIKLVPNDLRDYFCNEVAAHTDDPIVLMNLMRHKSLATTTKYSRRVLNRMRAAVENVGAKNGGEKHVSPGNEMSRNSLSAILSEIRDLRISIEEGE
jgi:integrase